MGYLTETEQHYVPEQLINEIAAQCSRHVVTEFKTLGEVLKSRFGQSLKIVLLYGSCLHTEDLNDSVVDLYAVVDNYNNAYKKMSLAILNKYFPPNVFYTEVPVKNLTLRAKYGVISMEDFEKGVGEWFHSYLWGRFAQPTRILYASDEASRERMHIALSRAVLTFLRRSIPPLGSSTVDAETIWTRGLALSYTAELRPERITRARQLTHLSLGDYTRLTACAAPAITNRIEICGKGRYRCLVSEKECRHSLWQWRVRTWQGRILSIMRLVKAGFTFRDSVDYAAWKIKRHTGISIEVTPKLKRYPILLGWRVLWQLMRRGILR